MTDKKLTFVPQSKNVNKHTAYGLRLLEKSIQQDGWLDGQTAAADGEIISGSARIELAGEKFADVEPIIVHSDGTRPVVVVRDDIPNANSPRARRLSVAANKIAQVDFDPDWALLKEWGGEDEQIKKLFSDDEWREGTERAGGAGEEQKQEPRKTLSERFGVPPFSVLNARGGLWQDRKKAWIDLGIKSELGRGGGGVPPPHPPTITQNEDGSLNYGGTTGQNARFDKQRQKGHKQKFSGALKDSEEYPDTLARKRMYDNKDNGLLGISQQARSHYKKEIATSNSSQSALTALQRGSAKVFGTEGNASEQTGTSIFDPVLCELAYRWFMPQDGGRILDPFAGGSVRGVVASLLGKEYTGVDLSARQIEANEQQGRDLCKDKQPRWINGDSLQIKELAGGEYDFVFSCPPYADLEVYSDDPADLSRMDYTDFIKAYRAIIAQCVSMLKDNRFACFVVGDIRDKNGFYRNFPAHTIDAFQDAGMILYNEAILVTAIGSLPIRVGRQFDGGRKLGKTHQNVLVFYKGNPKAIKDFGAVEFGEVEELQGADEVTN